MSTKNLKELKKSIVAIGYNTSPTQINIIGSGFCVVDRHHIVTCAHVYNQVPKEALNQLKAFVMVEEEKDYLEKYRWVSVTKARIDNDRDVVLLKLDPLVETPIVPLDLGNSDAVEIGQEIYLMGFPYAAQLINEGFGITSHISRTIISNIKRNGVSREHERNWLFFDTVNNPGNSGGPIVDIETNKVIGVISIALRVPSRNEKYKDLDIKEPMHIGAGKPINFVNDLIK